MQLGRKEDWSDLGRHHEVRFKVRPEGVGMLSRHGSKASLSGEGDRISSRLIFFYQYDIL